MLANMSVPESEILKPLDASNTNSDDWEIFVLKDAHITYESNGKPASLLAAYADTPLKVEGHLKMPGRSQLKYLLKKPYNPTDIEIRNVTRFSYGEMTDGAYVIWAQGKAGWFEIQPAPQYKPIYDEMIQAVELLYFVTDIHSEVRKKSGGPSAELIFQEYAEDKRFSCNDIAMVEEIFDKHHMFLMMCFLNRAQGLSWSNTPIYQRFRRRFPKDFDDCKARIEGRYSQIQSERLPTSSKSRSTPSLTSKQAATPGTSRHARRKSAGSKTPDAPKKDDNWWEAAALFEFMQKAVNQRVVRPGRNQITLDRVAELIVRRYEIEEVETAKTVLLVHAQNLCYMMDHPRRKTVQFFADEPIYQELAAGHNLSAAEQRRAENVELNPRKDHARLRDGQSDSSDTSDEEELRTPVRRPPGRRKKGRLSVLRPKTGNFSGKSKRVIIKPGKQIAGKGKAPVAASDASSELQSENEANSSSDLDMTDTPAQALSPSREKRKLGNTDTEHEAKDARRKRRNSNSLTFSSPPTTNDSDSSEADAEASASLPLPLRHLPASASSNSKPTVSPQTVSTPLPTYEANGPRDSWLCSFDGCTQRIYGCSKELGRQLITEHLEDHSRGRDKVVGILWREQNKLHLPVNNLIKKIREMSEASTPLFPSEQGGVKGEKVRPIDRPV